MINTIITGENTIVNKNTGESLEPLLQVLNSVSQKHNMSKEQKIKYLEKGKYKSIKRLDENIDDKEFLQENTKMNKEIINKIMDGRIEEFYKQHDIEKYLACAKDFIQTKLNAEKVSNRDVCKVMQLIKGQRFLVFANKNPAGQNRYCWLEVKKNDWKGHKVGDKTITGDVIVGRHIDDGIDLSHMADYLLEGKKEIIDKFPEWKDIKFIHSCTRIGDKDFIDRRETERKQNSSIKPSSIINLFRQEEEYAEYIGKHGREKGFWHKRIKPGSELWNTIEQYEKEKEPLDEGERLIDLEKMEERWKEHPEKQRSRNPEKTTEADQ